MDKWEHQSFAPDSCPLCQAKKITRWYYEDNLMWVADCVFCRVPMFVLKAHRPEPTPEEFASMTAKARELFGTSGFIDTEMRLIPDHFHFHVR